MMRQVSNERSKTNQVEGWNAIQTIIYRKKGPPSKISKKVQRERERERDRERK